MVFGRGDVIPMWVADMDFECPPCVVSAVRERAANPIYGYEYRGSDFFNSIIRWMDRRHGWRVEKDWIIVTPGVVGAASAALQALTEAGDGVLIMPPVYHPFFAIINQNHRTVIESPLVNNGSHYAIDFDDLDRKLPLAKVLLFCNPHNPVGRVFTREELQQVASLCRKHNVTIISDEIHSDLIMKPHRHIPMASLDEETAARTLTLMAPSKTFNLAGLSTSVAIAGDESIRSRMNAQIEAWHVGSCNIFGSAALEAAYNGGDEWLEQLLEYLSGNMDYVVDFVGKHLPGVATRKSEGTYMMWFDFRALSMSADELNDFIVQQAGLGLNQGTMFGTGGEGFMRINLATSRATVEKAMSQLRDALRARS